MNNKIFKKKSSFYLFSALTFLLVLVCVGGFFVFNASAANPDVAQGCVQITNLFPNGIVVRDESGSLISGTSFITVDRGKTIKLRLSFDDYHMGDESAFEPVTAPIVGSIYEDNNDFKENYNCMITKDPNDPTLFSLNLPNWTVSDSYYYAKVNLSFINRAPIIDTKKVTLTSIASDYEWVEAKDQFEVYDENKVKKDINSFFKVPVGSSSFTFYVKPTDRFKNNLESMDFSATHGTGLDYDVVKTDNTIEGEYRKVTLKLFNFGNIYSYSSHAFTDTISGVTYTYNTVKKKFTDNFGNSYSYNDTTETFTGKDGVIYKYSGNKDNKYYEDNRKIGNRYEYSGKFFTDTKSDVTYTYNTVTKKFTDNFGNSYSYNDTTETFTGKDGVIYRYNLGSNVFEDNRYDTVGIKKDLNLNLTASNITCNENRLITVNKSLDNNGNEVDLTNTNNVDVKIAVPDKKGDTPQYKDNFVLVKNVDENGQEDGTYRIIDTNKSTFELLECKYDSNKGGYIYEDVIYSYVEENYEKFKDNDENEYVYDENNKTFTGKNGVVYTYDEVNKKFKDNDGNEYVYDESNKTFMGKDGVVYTYRSGIDKKFRDNEGNEYAYNENNKTFVGRDNVEFVYDESSAKLSYKKYTGYENISVPYKGSVYITVTPTRDGWYNGSIVKLTVTGDTREYRSEMTISGLTDDTRKISVSGFELKNLSFSVDFSNANEGTNERVTISVSKITGKDTNNNDILEEIQESNGKYSGITPLGFVCKVSAGSENVNWQDIDLEGLKKEFSQGITVEEETETETNGRPYKKFTVKGLKEDVTLSITDVPYKTINVSFHEPVSSTDETPGNIIDSDKANIYLKDSTAKVTSFSSGQSWSFDFKFSESYESDIDENNKYTLVASIYALGENDEYTLIENKIAMVPESKEGDGRTFTFNVLEGVRGSSKVAIVVKNIVERKMPIQFKVSSDMASKNEGDAKYTLKDFTISYISAYSKDESGSYLPDVKPDGNGIYPYDAAKWANLNSTNWSTIDGDTDGDVLSEVRRIVPYNGMLVFRITLNDKSKIKYILNEKLLVSANGSVDVKVVAPEGSNKAKEDDCSCVQVVVKGHSNNGIKENMTGKTGSVSIGEFESSSKEVTFKFSNLDGVEYDLNNSENKTHAGNILEKMSVYRIDSGIFDTLNENDLYPSRILYECERKDDGTVENTKNSYMLNYKKEKNTIAVRAQQGIDVKNIKCFIKIDNENREVASSYIRTTTLSEDDDGYIVVIQIPDDEVGVNTPDGVEIEISGIDIIKYNISLEGFDDVGIERRLSSESEFKELGADERSFKVDYGEDFEIKIKGEAKHSSEGLFNRISLRGGALFLKEGTQSGGVALEKNSDGSFSYIFFVYKVKSDSAIEFSNVINKVILDFDNVDGMEFYECSNGEVAPDKKIQGKISCEYGNKYSFAVKASTGYSLETFKLKATVEGSETIEEGSTDFSNMFDYEKNGDYKIYTIVNKNKDKSENGVQKSTVISGSINKETKTITFATPQRPKEDTSVESILSYLNEQGDEISSMNADYGSNVAFAIKLGDKYSNSNITVDLYENVNNKKGEHIETLHTVSGYYKITNITKNYIVEVSGHSVNSYFVNFSKNDYVDYSLITDGEESAMSDNVSVLYGGSCYFKVKEKEGYKMGESSVVQATSASGQKITLEKNSLGQYKLTNIKDNYTITVENIDEIFYSLKFITTDGVTYYNEVGSVITGDFKVGYGKNFEFSIKIDDAHSESIQGAYIVTNESGQSEVKIQKLASDRYLIQNITQDITIRVANVNKNKYTITLTKDEGIDYYNKDGKVITGENEVEYGGSLSFKVNLYPLYANSNIKVMLGNQELSADDNEYYTVETVTENKTVTVVGIGKTDVAEVIETISSLPTDISDDTELEQIIQAVRDYNNLSDAEKSSVGNYYVLEQLQKKVANIIHTYNGVTAEGLDWNIKLIANPIDTDIDACTRIYGKLNSEYILSLYDVYLWDTLTDRRYTLPEGKSIVIHLPTPNMTYFENPSGIHENSDGKLNFLSLNMGNSVTSLETSSLSPIGIVADRSIQPGRSSLIDAVDSNVSMLTNYALGSISGSGNKKESNFSGNKNNSSNTFDEGEALTGGSNSGTNKFRKTDNSTTRLGSALKLILIIMILLIIIAVIWALVKKFKDKSKKSKE